MTAKPSTESQTSAGGVAFRKNGDKTEVALISVAVGDKTRWQLPKGIVNSGEATEDTARREVREETGLDAEILNLIDRIEYWYYATRKGQRVRYHKTVSFYLMRYLSGNVAGHDHEVVEARWVDIDEAQKLLAFQSEKQIVAQAKEMIETMG